MINNDYMNNINDFLQNIGTSKQDDQMYEDLTQEYINLLEEILDYVYANANSHPVLVPIIKMNNIFLGIHDAPSLGELKRMRSLDDTYKNTPPNQLKLDEF
jgi:hypothetical protein